MSPLDPHITTVFTMWSSFITLICRWWELTRKLCSVPAQAEDSKLMNRHVNIVSNADQNDTHNVLRQMHDGCFYVFMLKLQKLPFTFSTLTCFPVSKSKKNF